MFYAKMKADLSGVGQVLTAKRDDFLPLLIFLFSKLLVVKKEVEQVGGNNS